MGLATSPAVTAARFSVQHRLADSEASHALHRIEAPTLECRAMLSNLAQAVLFLSSYAPLLVVFALLDSFGPGWPTVVCAAIAASSVVGLLLVLRSLETLSTSAVEVNGARRRDEDVMAYVVTYLLPFVGLGTDGGRQQLALLVFVVVVAVVYVRAQLFYVNPILSILGYRLFEVSTECGRSITLLTPRDHIRKGQEIKPRRLSNYVFWEKR